MSEFREFGECDGALVEVRLITDDWSGDWSTSVKAARLTGMVRAAAARCVNAHRAELQASVPEVTPPRMEEPIEVVEHRTFHGLVTEYRYELGRTLEAIGEVDLGDGEIVRQVIRTHSGGTDPRRCLDELPMPKSLLSAVSHDGPGGKPTPISWTVAPMPVVPPPPGPRPAGMPDPELEEARRQGAYYGGPLLDPVAKLEQERAKQQREAERQAVAAEAERRERIRDDARRRAHWQAGAALGEVLGLPGLPGPAPRKVGR